MVIAQVGLDAVAGGLVSVLFIVWLATLLSFLIFLFVWYLPEIFRLWGDWLTGRDLVAESQEERKSEGRLFGPQVDNENEP